MVRGVTSTEPTDIESETEHTIMVKFLAHNVIIHHNICLSFEDVVTSSPKLVSSEGDN